MSADVKSSEVELRLGEWTERPLSNLSSEIEPFWDALRDGEFRLCRCRLCGKHYFPYTVCPDHEETPEFSDMEWTTVSGKGTLFAYSNVYAVNDPAFAADIPYTTGLIELAEGPLLPTRIVGCAPEDVKIGMPLTLSLTPKMGSGFVYPFFRPDRDQG